MLKKVLFITLGTISLSCGILGIVVPGLPTTPFVLLAAWFYIRSSETLHQKLVSNRLLGKYISGYSQGVTRKAKYRIYALMWCMILLSSIFFIENTTVRIIVVAAGIIGTVVVWRLKEPLD